MVQLDNEPCMTIYDKMLESDYNPVNVARWVPPALVAGRLRDDRGAEHGHRSVVEL